MTNEHLVQLDDYRGFEVYFHKRGKYFTIQNGDTVIAKSTSWAAVTRRIRKDNYDPKLLESFTARKVVVKTWRDYEAAELTGNYKIPDETRYSYNYDHLKLEVVVPGRKPEWVLPENIFFSDHEDVAHINGAKERKFKAEQELYQAENKITAQCLSAFIKKGKIPE